MEKFKLLLVILTLVFLVVASPALALDDDQVDVDVSVESWASLENLEDIAGNQWIEGELNTDIPEDEISLPAGSEDEFRGEPGEIRSAKTAFEVISNVDYEITADFNSPIDHEFQNEFYALVDGALIQLEPEESSSTTWNVGEEGFELYMELQLPDDATKIEPGTHTGEIQFTISEDL